MSLFLWKWAVILIVNQTSQMLNKSTILHYIPLIKMLFLASNGIWRKSLGFGSEIILQLRFFGRLELGAASNSGFR
jgi:hypothetical protein